MIVVLLAIVLGILTGYSLSLIAPEELADGKKYFIILRRVLSVLIVLFIAYQLSLLYATIFVFLSLLTLFLIEKRSIYYQAFAYLLFFIATFFTEQFIISSLLFIYGFPIGSLWQCQRKKI